MQLSNTKLALASLLLLSSISLADQAADAQAAILDQSSQKPVSSNKHPDAQWFPDAGLGLFIHWGIASVGASGDISWGMLANKPWKDKSVTPNTYYGKIDLIWFDGGKGEIPGVRKCPCHNPRWSRLRAFPARIQQGSNLEERAEVSKGDPAPDRHAGSNQLSERQTQDHGAARTAHQERGRFET